MDKNQINIVYASNNNYIPLVWVSLKSIFEYNSESTIMVYLIVDDVEKSNINKIKNLTDSYKATLKVINFSDITRGLENAQLFSGGKTTYARLFISNAVEEDKIIYLDCDTIVHDNIKKLWDEDVEKYDIAGIQDMVVPKIREAIGLKKDEPYVNSGVLLINLKRWREKRLEEKFVEYISEMKGQVPCHDQGTINHVCRGNIKILPAKFNVMTPMFCMKANEIKRFYELSNYYTDSDIKDACNRPVVVHLTAGWYVRPWLQGSKHPFNKYYSNIYDISPWGNVPMKKGRINKKSKLMMILYKILPFSIYINIAKIKRGK